MNMFCPKCAAQNVEGAHFCRACGANISLVSQALNGQLPTVQEDDGRLSRRRRRRGGTPSLDEGIRNLIMGIGFVAVAIALAFFGRPIGANVWWFWMLIPAFGMMGKGVSDIVRARQLKAESERPALPYMTPPERLPESRPNELRPPVASVTEGTTRHLGTEAPTKSFDLWKEQKPS
jgi:hypothetical protein